jgi:ABC-type glucose/galactose transport system permease subunit
LTVGFFGLISGISIVYLAAVEYACKVFPKMKRLVIVRVLKVSVCMIAFELKNFDKLAHDLINIAGLVSAAGIPLILLIIAKVRNRGKATY